MTAAPKKGNPHLVYVLLAGLSLENILKGLIIFGDPAKYVKLDGQLHKSLTKHNLVALAERANLYGACSPEQKAFLQRAEEAIPY